VIGSSQRAASSPKLGNHLVTARDRHVVDARTPAARPLGSSGDEVITEADGFKEFDLKLRRDVSPYVLQAKARALSASDAITPP
jgi:hypothetical protein